MAPELFYAHYRHLLSAIRKAKRPPMCIHLALQAAQLTAAKTVLEQQNAHAEAKQRRAWWTPALNLQVRADTPLERDAIVSRPQLRMLRRSTLAYFYSANQVHELLTTVLVPSAWL